MFDTGLADRCRAKGVDVVEVAGWKTRTASGTFNPRGSVNHHTAGSGSGTAPSLGVCIRGRGEPNPLPGPLCNVLQSREVGAPDKAYVIAAGRTNHAGSGSWRGLSGNGSVSGLEVEHTGTGPVPIGRLEVSARIHAAMLEAPGSTRDAAYCCQHSEWTPRKIDFFSLAPWDVAYFRVRVAYWIGRKATGMDAAELRKELTNPDPKASRKILKAIALGAVLDGVRKPDETHPDRGDLREPIKDVLKEAILELKADGLL